MQQNNNLEFLDILAIVSFAMQVANYQQNIQQTSNDDLLKELQRQDKIYLEKIIENQNKILKYLIGITDMSA